jgi:hypothetical protein
MTALMLDLGLDRSERPSILGSRAAGDARDRRPRGGLTLDEVIVGAWEGLAAHHPARCPICSGTMTPRYGSGPGPVAGRCGDCGSTLG